MMDWFTERANALMTLLQPDVEVVEVTHKDVRFYGLDLKQELEEHYAWREHLQDMLDGKWTGGLDIATLEQHEHCGLGQWIHGEGKKHYGHLPEYEAVCKAHEEFHACAAAVLTHYLNGNATEAAKLLNTKFRTVSNQSQLQLIHLFTLAGQ